MAGQNRVYRTETWRAEPRLWPCQTCALCLPSEAHAVLKQIDAEKHLDRSLPDLPILVFQ